jgi:hypothetical protein
MKKLNEYIKPEKSDENSLIVTSIYIEKRHHDFIKSMKINLSTLIRDFLADLIKENKTPKK